MKLVERIGFCAKEFLTLSHNIDLINQQNHKIMFGGMEEIKKQMQEALTAVTVEAEAGGGMIKIRANAARQILDVSIDPALDLNDKEELEDLILEAMNRVIAAAAVKEQEESQAMMAKLLPPGMGDLGGLFG